MTNHTTELEELKNMRWLALGAFGLGVLASLAANVLHADPNVVSRVISAWPPIALVVTVELISRIRARSRWLSGARIVATAIVALIAAWISYWHMAGVASRYGEEATAAHLVPFSVDGLMVVASISLVEISRRIQHLKDQQTEINYAWANADTIITQGTVEVVTEPASEETPVEAPELPAEGVEPEPEATTPPEGVETPTPRSAPRGSHASCDHEATAAARAACRRAREAA